MAYYLPYIRVLIVISLHFMGKLFHPATKTPRHEGKNRKQYLCVLVTLWQIFIEYFSGLSGLDR